MSVCLPGLLFHFLSCWAFCKCNHTVYVFPCLFPLSVMFQRFLHIVACSWDHLVFSCRVFHCAYLFHHWWVRGVFSICATKNSTAVNILNVDPSHCECTGVSLAQTHLGVSVSSTLLDTPNFLRVVGMGYSSTSSVSAFLLCVFINTWFNLCFCGYWWRCFKIQCVNRKFGV